MGKIKFQPLLFIIFISTQYFCFSQIKITGSVKNNSSFLNGASIILKNVKTNKIITYSYTDYDGNFSLTSNIRNSIKLEVSLLGYEVKSIPIRAKKQSFIHLDILLKEKNVKLEEVIIQATKPISVKNDTIKIKTKFYTSGTEQTVEDLLKKIPGLTVEKDGSIKVGNKKIEKLMVDGDDFFGKGYKLLTKNMPAYPIEEVEILNNFSNNKLLKSIEESNKVALNLKMNNQYKRIWFGNTTTGYGLFSENRYDFKLNLMNFGKKNKYFSILKLNNTGEGNNLIANDLKASPNNTKNDIGVHEKNNTLIQIKPTNLRLEKQRNLFNNEELASLSAIFNPSEKIKLKTVNFLNLNEIDFFRNSITSTTFNNTIFTNIETQLLRNKNTFIYGQLDVDYDISNSSSLTTTTKYNFSQFNDSSNLNFNQNATLEGLKSENKLFDQKISYTHKINNQRALILNAKFISNETPQKYTSNQFFFDDLFPDTSNANNISQIVNNSMDFFGIAAHLLNRKDNGNLFEVKLTNTFRIDTFNSNFSIFNNTTPLETQNDYQNRTSYKVNDFSLQFKYLYKINDFSLISSLDFRKLNNSLENTTGKSKQRPFFINPKIMAKWKINNLNKINLSYSYNTSNAKLLDVIENYSLTGFRSFNRGTGDFNQLNASKIILNYQFGNWTERFFINFFASHIKNHDFFSYNTIVNQNFILSEKKLFNDREFFTLTSKLDYYFSSISSNLKIDFGLSESNYENIVNSITRLIRNKNYKYGLELRSGFKGFFNYHIGTKWQTYKITTSLSNSFTDNLSFLDLSFNFNNKLSLLVQSERQFFGNLKKDNSYYFVDLEAKHEIIRNKLSISLIGKNLTNTEKFRNSFNTDLGTYTNEYNLLPRFFLLKFEYRF